MSLHYTAKGIAYISFEWATSFVELIVVSLRLYSRGVLTRSIGSDDFAILIAFSLDIVEMVIDLEAFLNGWAEHGDNLSVGRYSSEQKWEWIGYEVPYLVYFFVRASVLLFVLRLLPSYKKWQQRLVYLILFINFAITAIACVTFGVSCIPFQENWDPVSGDPKCFSKDKLVVVNQVNAALSCVCDIATAVIPVFLLWNVQMKRRTKMQLNVLFSLGLVTAALSIARAAVTTKKSLEDDATWNEVPVYYLFCFEEKLSVIFACGPALRQFFAYTSRVRSCLPTRNRQYPNQDFEKMRWRINIRDIFWYRQAPMTGGRVLDAAPTFQRLRTPPPDPGHSNVEKEKVKSSKLDVWERKLGNIFRFGKKKQSLATAAQGSSSAERLARNPDTQSCTWNYTSADLQAPDLGPGTFLQPGTGASHGEILSPIHDQDFAEELANPKTRPLSRMA